MVSKIVEKRRYLKCDEKTVGNRSREEESAKKKQRLKGICKIKLSKWDCNLGKRFVKNYIKRWT